MGGIVSQPEGPTGSNPLCYSSMIRERLVRFNRLVLTLFLFMSPAAAISGQPPAPRPDPSSFERILIPAFVYGLEGAGGSRWTSTFIYRNDADVPVPIFSSYEG